MLKLLEISFLVFDMLIEIEEADKGYQNDMVPWAQHSGNRVVMLLASKLVF